MKSLDAFNADRAAIWDLIQPKPSPNGIGCPECGEELMDSDPAVTLTSNPPRKHVHCPKCQYRGSRVA